MTITHIFASLKRYGAIGVWHYLRGIAHKNAIRKTWEPFLIPDPHHKPQVGITIIGSLSGNFSLSKTLRDFCYRLKIAGIPYQAFDTGCDNQIPHSEYAHLLTPRDIFKINKYSDIVGMFHTPPLPKVPCRISNIVFWEFESGFCEIFPEFLEPQSLITYSDFNHHVFNQLCPTSSDIHKILYPFQFAARDVPDRAATRTKYNIGLDDFIVFFNFDYRSGYFRKNPEAIVAAFAMAFQDIPKAKLVFKTSGSKLKPKLVSRLQNTINSAGIESRVYFIDSYIPQNDLVGLTNACDVYISLHRGEGFGIGIAEAMYLGKPVIITNYAAPTEFCNTTNALLIPYSMVAPTNEQMDFENYRKVNSWAEPDIAAAANALRKLYENTSLRVSIGQAAANFMRTYFSDKNFKTSVMKFLSRN